AGEYRGIAQISQGTTEDAPAIASRAVLATPAADLLAVDPVPDPQPDIACSVPEGRLERHDLRPIAGDLLRLPLAPQIAIAQVTQTCPDLGARILKSRTGRRDWHPAILRPASPAQPGSLKGRPVRTVTHATHSPCH